MCTFIEMDDKDIINFLNETRDTLDGSVTEKFITKTILDNILNKQDFVDVLQKWKVGSMQRLILLLNEICKNEISQEVCKDFFLKKIVPKMMALEIEFEIKDNLIEVAFMLCSLIPVTDLTPNEYKMFLAEVFSKYIPAISQLRDSNYANWHKLWIFLVRFCSKNIHDSMDLTNRLLRIVEYAFRNSAFEQRLKGYDCWKELIDNASLDPNHMCTPKQIKLLITPLRAKFSKQEVVISKRFNIFVYLLEKLQSKAMLCLPEFLEFCFGPVGDSTNNARTGQAKCVPQIGSKSAKVLVAILGHSHMDTVECVNLNVSFQKPIVDGENFQNVYKIIINSVAECCILLKDDILENKRKKAIKCLWKSILNLIISSPEPERIEYCTVLTEVLDKYLKHYSDNPYFEDLIKTIFVVLMTFESNVLDNIVPLILKQLVTIFISTDVGHTISDQFKQAITQSFSKVLLEENKIKMIEIVINCLLDNIIDDKTSINYSKVWTILANELTTGCNPEKFSDIIKFQEFFMWPSQNLHRLEEANKKQIVLHWMKLHKKVTADNELKKLIILNNLKKMFANNPLLSSNISCLLNTISQFETKLTKEFVTKLLDVVYLVVQLPNLHAEDENKLTSLVMQYFEPSLECYKSEELDDLFKVLCACIEHIIAVHSGLKLIDPLVQFIQNCPENLQNLFSKYLKDLSLELHKKETESNNYTKAKEIFKIVEVFTSRNKNNDEEKKTFVIPSGRSARIANMGKNSPRSPLKTAKPNTTLRLFGKDPETMSPLKVKGSQLNNSPNTKKKKGINNINIKPTTNRSVNEENSLDFVPIDTEVKLQRDKLSEHQKEVLNKRREDIPALYQDLSQSISQDMFSSKSNSKEATQEVVIKQNLNLEEDIFSQVSKQLHIESNKTDTPLKHGSTDKNKTDILIKKISTDKDKKIESSSSGDLFGNQEKKNEVPISDDLFSTSGSSRRILTARRSIGSDKIDDKSLEVTPTTDLFGFLMSSAESKQPKDSQGLEDEDRAEKKKKREINRLKMNLVGANTFVETPKRTRVKNTPKKEEESQINKTKQQKKNKEEKNQIQADNTQSIEKLEKKPKNQLINKVHKESSSSLETSLEGEDTSSLEISKHKRGRPKRIKENQEVITDPVKSREKIAEDQEVLTNSVKSIEKKKVDNQVVDSLKSIKDDTNKNYSKLSDSPIRNTIRIKIKEIMPNKNLVKSLLSPKHTGDFKKVKTPKLTPELPKKNRDKSKIKKCFQVVQDTNKLTDSSISATDKIETISNKETKAISESNRKGIRKRKKKEILDQALLTPPLNFTIQTQKDNEIVKNKKESSVEQCNSNIKSKSKKKITPENQVSGSKSRSSKIMDKLESSTDSEKKSKRRKTEKLNTEKTPETKSPKKLPIETPKNIKPGRGHKKKLLQDLLDQNSISETQEIVEKNDVPKITSEENEDIIESSQESFVELIPLLNSSKKKSLLTEESKLMQNEDLENTKMDDENTSEIDTAVIKSYALEQPDKIELINEEDLKNDVCNSQDTTLTQNNSTEDTFSTLDTFAQVSKTEVNDALINSPEPPKKPQLTESELFMCQMDTMSVCASKDTMETEEKINTFIDVDVKKLEPVDTLNSIEDILAMPSTETAPSSSPGTPKSQSIPSSPITIETPNRTSELLDNTMDISPITSRSNSDEDIIVPIAKPININFEELENVVIEGTVEPMEEIQELVAKVKEFVNDVGKSDSFEEENSSEDSETVDASSEAEMTPLESAAENNLENFDFQEPLCPNDENPIQNGQVSTTINIISNRAFKEPFAMQDRSSKLQKMRHTVSTKPFTKRKTGTTSSPSAIRIKKLFINMGQKQSNHQEVLENFSENDILTFSRDIPSPLAVPRSSILKRKLSDSSEGEGISPCPKRKRVNFSDPCLTSRKIFIKDEYQPSLEAKCLFDNTSDQKSTDEHLKDIFDYPDDSPCSGFSTETDSDLAETEPSLAIINPMILQKVKPIFSKLVQCDDDVLVIVKRITSPMFVPALMNKLKGKNVKTIGDLARLSEAEVNRFPFKVPVVANVLKALENYYWKKYSGETRSEAKLGNCRDEEKQNGDVEMPKLDVKLELKMLIKRAQREKVPSDELAKILLPHVDHSKLYPLIKSHCPSIVLDTLEEKDYTTILKIIIDSKGISEILKRAHVTFHNAEKEHDFYQAIADYVKYTVPLEKFFKGRSIEDLEVGIEESIKNKVFQKNEIIENCLLPLIDSPEDISSYLNSLSVITFDKLVINRLKNEDPGNFFQRIIKSFSSEEGKTVSELLYCQQPSSSLEIVACFKKKLELQNEEDKTQSMIEMFNFISNEIDVKRLVDLHIVFLSRISGALEDKK